MEVLQHERGNLLRFLRHRLGCPDAAEDVFQSLSERLVSNRQKTKISEPRAYLFKAAANAAHSYTRATKTRSQYEAAAADQQQEAEPRDPERIALGHSDLAIVQAALNELPLLTRQMFFAFRVHGTSQTSIAESYGVSLSTVEKRIAKAAAHCHRRLVDSESSDTAIDGRLTATDAAR